jgi:hypothetical protein
MHSTLSCLTPRFDEGQTAQHGIAAVYTWTFDFRHGAEMSLGPQGAQDAGERWKQYR